MQKLKPHSPRQNEAEAESVVSSLNSQEIKMLAAGLANWFENRKKETSSPQED